MDIRELQQNWEEFGRQDPMWAILTEPDKRSGGWDESQFFANGRALVGAIVKQLAEFGVPGQRGLALDFGCGLGRLTQAACEHFEHVIGVDIAASMIEGARARNQFGDRCHYLHNTRPDLRDVESGSIDFVLSLLVLQHMRTELGQGYIVEFLRMLRPGGVAVFQMPFATKPGYKPPSRPDEPGPIMEMHATPKERVLELIQQGGASLVACREDDGGGKDWLSYVYVAVKD